ncbi:MAG TPA: ATPase, T2SS/T4P/T4SS family [Actinomycetota bacterium]|nr:ATPase, T2SS/T4P/T4SS family [Actinomycetota bacterium]
MPGDKEALTKALDLVYEHDEIADLDEADRRLALRKLLRGLPNGLTLVSDVADAIDGYGPLSPLMRDPAITDVLVNGPSEVWIERDGHLERTPVDFGDDEALFTFIHRVVGEAGGRVDAARPVGDVRLADGSRMHVVLPPLSCRGPIVSIRRFPVRRDLNALVGTGMFDRETAEKLARSVKERRTIAISGPTGSGKTTLMNALLSLIDESERIVVLEESSELDPAAPHVVSLVTRPPNVEGGGEVTLADLVRAALRMRPDRIVVGEVRGREARIALDAMSTGHPGSLVTIHASSARRVRERFVSLASDGHGDFDRLGAVFDAAFDVIVQLGRVDGMRRVIEVVEI